VSRVFNAADWVIIRTLSGVHISANLLIVDRVEISPVQVRRHLPVFITAVVLLGFLAVAIKFMVDD